MSMTLSPFDDLISHVRGGLQITDHSGKIQPGGIFVAVPGPVRDGADFIPQADLAGAGFIVTRNDAPWPDGMHAQRIVHPDPAQALGELAAVANGTDNMAMRVTGVTGTNGKTSICYLLEHLFSSNTAKAGILGTIDYRWPGFRLEANLTTPGCLQLHELLGNMNKASVDVAFMEVSSHAIDQKRIAGISYDAAVLTNITQDHLDYHGDMESYFQTKAKLFTELLKFPQNACINYNDPFGQRLLTKLDQALAYGLDDVPHGIRRALRGRIIDIDDTGITMVVDYEGKTWEIRSPMAGRHNAQNLLAAQAVGLSLGLSPNQMAVFNHFHGAPGRLERIANDKGKTVFVDYAHTPDALVNVCRSLRELPYDRLIVVFGCGGDRDKTKRPRMGEAVCQYADVAVVTSDNPRHEDPQAIIDDIRPGLGGCTRVMEQVDRKKAIITALDMMHDNDVLLIAGKGHETYQQIGDTKHHFNDAEIVWEHLA
ncbi:UDP-N-acetylmuramoyl-L-alanyl-D-glutamate--2,6-diaminopimelate ligase [Desulfovibrio inopinatus]|uniref:UDP-N-acetylmuramoyl-L-alanyl-D-glutamate--2, 6-diaminopimelate ligase n=1 Tax=Desulfovibrio inopinatus TaxID=102109 RepID=UPI0004263C9F|nr:UDP-N-acetylmuramoyl-L-alanyl-D-glutamate--2,6-diaminopimelate ligase [Desulfovibrio inopinatus]